MLHFVLAGGRHIDSAQLYRNHHELRKAVRWAGELRLPREELFIATKIHGGLFGRARARLWFEAMLKETGLEYLDLVLLHGAAAEPGGDWPVVSEHMPCGSPPQCRRETWEVLAEFMAAGRVRDIGVSNFGVRQMTEIMELGVAPIAVNQLEYHPFTLEPERKAVEFCHRHGIAVTAYSPFGSGAVIGWFSGSEQLPVKHMARVHGKSPGQVLLRWATQKNISVIPKSARPERQRENMDIFSFNLSDQEVARIDALPWRLAALPNPWDSCDAPDSIWSAGEAGFWDRVKQFVDGNVAKFRLPPQ
mmetsp:Transcript_107418/g.334850  ORF Transcript_107418/g.334850 Transcript_107418/m.334850 type:complete len:304 (+) Transcript_107418:3-914(+)